MTTTTPAAPAVSRQAAVDAALLILKSMGLSLDDLTAAPSSRPPVPTFAEYVPVVAATVTPGTWTSRRRRRPSSSWPTSRRTRCRAATAGAGAMPPRA
jgi:hypothetical protein